MPISSIRRARRDDLAPRVEMLPLIDIVFLLLTFFISSLIVMVQAEVLPVQLVGVGTGEYAEAGEIHAVTIDRQGQLYWDREPVEPAELDAELSEISGQDPQPQLFVALEEDLAAMQQGEQPPATDRGPLLMQLVQRAQEAGVENFSFVGRPWQPSEER